MKKTFTVLMTEVDLKLEMSLNCVWGDGILCPERLKTETPSDMRMFVIFILSLFPQGSFLFEHHQRIKLS